VVVVVRSVPTLVFSVTTLGWPSIS
jgi:hypothetical protein